MEQSILTSVKNKLGIETDITAFDLDVLTFINAAFSTLRQLGVGPVDGFSIDDDSSNWEDFLSEEEDLSQLNAVKIYVYLRVRLLFDPPASSYALKSFEDQINELVFRLNVERESTAWVDPLPAEVPSE